MDQQTSSEDLQAAFDRLEDTVLRLKSERDDLFETLNSLLAEIIENKPSWADGALMTKARAALRKAPTPNAQGG